MNIYKYVSPKILLKGLKSDKGKDARMQDMNLDSVFSLFSNLHQPTDRSATPDRRDRSFLRDPCADCADDMFDCGGRNCAEKCLH